MLALDALMCEEAKIAHGHLCAGQILGRAPGDAGVCCASASRSPAGPDRKRLVTFVEIDRCATDAIGVVTGCRLGKRALKFRDWGKMAATFVDVKTGRAVRVAAKESSKALARQMHPEIENKNLQQMQAYREMQTMTLVHQQWVKVDLPPEEFPGYKGERIVCDVCGEGINLIAVEFATAKLCLSCAAPVERYCQPLGSLRNREQ